MIQAAIIMGSASDLDKVKPCMEILDKLEVKYKATVASAHRTPERVENFRREAENSGAKVFICAAGMAAHLAGALAARTLLPVIGIPISASALAGMDALFSTVQMPPGFPVATVALDKAGAANAAWLAAQIIALNDPDLAARIGRAREDMRRKVEAAAREIEKPGDCPPCAAI